MRKIGHLKLPIKTPSTQIGLHLFELLECCIELESIQDISHLIGYLLQLMVRHY